jgi:hypothetical protein
MRCRLALIVLVVGFALAPFPALADVVVPSADVTTGVSCGRVLRPRVRRLAA